MTNAEKWAKTIIHLARNAERVAVVNGKPVPCSDVRSCEGCLFNPKGNTLPCIVLRKKWFDAEYTEPSVDWSKVPVDTKVLVSNDGKNWYKRYFAGMSRWEEKKVFPNGQTSYSCESDFYHIFPYIKLAETEDEVKK